MAEIFREHEELPGNWNKQPEALFSGVHTANPFSTVTLCVSVCVCLSVPVCMCVRSGDKNCWSLITSESFCTCVSLSGTGTERFNIAALKNQTVTEMK